MAIPNTTPTPNIIFNGLMAKMSDTEFRVVMAVVRATLGWELDHKTGMRKTEDWISHSQLKRITGRGSASLAKAIDSCIKNGWIEARDKEGELLDTKNKRVGKRIFYRLGAEILLRDENGQVFVKESKPLQKVKRSTSSKSEKVAPTSSESEISESETYKRNTITKYNNIIPKGIRQSNPPTAYGNKDINHLIELLKKANGGLIDGSEQLNRRYCWNLLQRFKYKEDPQRAVRLVEMIIKIAKEDKFHSANATGFKYLFNNAVKILQGARKKIPKVGKISINNKKQ